MGAGGSSPACIRKAASNKGGSDLPRQAARRRIPRHAVWDSEYRDGAVACKICHKEHSTTSLGHSEVLSVPNDPSHGGSYSAPPGHGATMYARTRCRCARSPSGHGQRYPAAYLLRGAGYKISPPPPGGQVGYGIVLHFSRLRSPFGVEFGFTHFLGCAMMWQTNRICGGKIHDDKN